jgi:outer membrane protein insertion porin family
MRTVIPLFAALLLLAPISAPALAQYSIASVVFANAAPYTDAELLTASGLQPGQFLAHDSLVNAAQRLLNTGLFADASVDLTGQGKARTVHVDLKPIPLDKLLPASFENLAWFTPDELTTGIHARVALYRGVASDAGTLPDDIQAALQQMLAEKGVTATLSHTIVEPTTQHPVRVVDFTIDKPSVRLDKLHLSLMSPPGAAAALTPGLQKAANQAARSPFNEGLAGTTLGDILLNPIRNAGYINARLDSIERTVARAPAQTQAPGFLVTYTARIVTGDAYKLSSLTWQPTPLYSAADFARDAKLHPGDLANANALAQTEAAISTAYLSHGYLDAYLTAPPTLDDTAHNVAYALAVLPGDVYHLKTVTPTGLSAEAQQEFITAWQMKPGDIYNPSYVAAFIHNNTALRHLSTYAGTFRAEADPQTHLVDLTVTFFPSNGN